MRAKGIWPKDRLRVFELASLGLSVRQIAERMGISSRTARGILVKGLTQCRSCRRIISGRDLCPVCSLPAEAPFCDRLKAFRTVADLSQAALALAIGVHESTVRNWQNGRKQPTDHELKMIAEALGLTVEELTGKA